VQGASPAKCQPGSRRRDRDWLDHGYGHHLVEQRQTRRCSPTYGRHVDEPHNVRAEGTDEQVARASFHETTAADRARYAIMLVKVARADDTRVEIAPSGRSSKAAICR